MIVKYRNLAQTLGFIKRQADASLAYASKMAQQSNPYDLYYYLKSQVTYKHDRPGIEQLQKLQTLLGDANVHGVPGLGDCDCFTIALLALCKANNFTPAGAVLAGHYANKARHIYNYCTYGGKLVYLDLTESEPGQLRPYKFRQEVKFYN
jgi:hypothetical protein